MQERLLDTLQRLLAIPASDVVVALSEAADLVSRALDADKTDVFLFVPERASLIALGRSDQPLSQRQRDLGLDVLAVANGGRAVRTFESDRSFVTGRLDQDPEELRGVREALAVRSLISVPMHVDGARRGVLMLSSKRPELWGADDLRFVESVAQWIGAVAHRAELVERIAENAVAQGRRAAAEELMTTLAHDLRNHPSPISVRLGLMRRRAERDERERDVRDLDLSLRALARLGAMISDMLDIARIEQGMLRVDVQPVELVALVEETATMLSTAEGPIEVRGGQPLVAAADPDRIRQTLENLLANAVRHSPKGAPVMVVVERATLADERPAARVAIIDQGPGVAPEVLPRLFDRFVSGVPGGLGLGLYLAKRIATLHGGDVTVESAPGKGARFTLSLPLASA